MQGNAKAGCLAEMQYSVCDRCGKTDFYGYKRGGIHHLNNTIAYYQTLIKWGLRVELLDNKYTEEKGWDDDIDLCLDCREVLYTKMRPVFRQWWSERKR